MNSVGSQFATYSMYLTVDFVTSDVFAISDRFIWLQA